MIGMRTSKIMLPFGRNGHLHTSASFKTIFENISTNHENNVKIDYKVIDNQWKIIKKMMRKKIETYYPNYANISNSGSSFGRSCLNLSRSSAFFNDLFFGTSRRYPLGPIPASPGAPCSISSTFGKISGAKSSSQIERFQSNKWHQPHL